MIIINQKYSSWYGSSYELKVGHKMASKTNLLFGSPPPVVNLLMLSRLLGMNFCCSNRFLLGVSLGKKVSIQIWKGTAHRIPLVKNFDEVFAKPFSNHGESVWKFLVDIMHTIHVIKKFLWCMQKRGAIESKIVILWCLGRGRQERRGCGERRNGTGIETESGE